MKIVLYYPKKDNIIEVTFNTVIDEMYMNLAMIPTMEQLLIYSDLDTLFIDESTNFDSYSDFDKLGLIKKYIKNLKDFISRLKYKIPLYDHSTKNIYLTQREDVYSKVTIENYRFPDKKIIKLLNETLIDLNAINQHLQIEWIDAYKHKITKNLNFLSNYDLDILKHTYTEAFIDTNPLSRELTTCIKPSYLPYQNYQSPYYTKSELISMGLNLGIIIDKKIRPWSYSKQTLKSICSKLSKYEINTQMLIYNQLYILYNNAKAYVQYYSLFGSYYFNSYMRRKSSLDVDLNKHIDNFLKLIKQAPAFDSEYEVYRFIETDDYLAHLKIGDVFEERSFISTTRNPFYSMTDNKFGFILIKIKLKPNIIGTGLLIESYSNYSFEQEVLIPPSKIKLIEINTDFKYYHWNKLAEKRIIKKYIFEYIEPLSYDIDYYVKDYYVENTYIPVLDFYQIQYMGSNTNERTLNFFNSLPTLNLRRIFESIIGKTKYKFYAYFLTQNKVYSKFFFLQKEEQDLNRMLGDQIYLTIQNPDNGQIELLIEIRNIISVNYYHRYSGLTNIISDNDLLHWLAGLAKALDINNIIIHGNYSSYAHIVEDILNQTNIDQHNLLENFKTIQNIDNPDANILNLYTSDINTYCVDLINYICNDTKRFANLDYVERKIPLHMIDKLKTITVKSLYEMYKSTRSDDYLFKVYRKLIIQYDSIQQTIFDQHVKSDQHIKYDQHIKSNADISIFDFYKYLHKTFPYLVSKLQELIIPLYPKNTIGPWHFYYVYKPFEYLFEKKLIPFIPQSNIDKIEEFVKNLQDEIKFIHDNKFRQIML